MDTYCLVCRSPGFKEIFILIDHKHQPVRPAGGPRPQPASPLSVPQKALVRTRLSSARRPNPNEILDLEG